MQSASLPMGNMEFSVLPNDSSTWGREELIQLFVTKGDCSVGFVSTVKLFGAVDRSGRLYL